MKTVKKRFFIVFILAAIFLAPTLLAYLYFRHPTWLQASSTNRGQFVTPIYRLKSLTRVDNLDFSRIKQKTQHGLNKFMNNTPFQDPQAKREQVPRMSRWRLVYWHPKSCASACMKHVDTLARIRLALGRRLYQVDACVLLDESLLVLSPQQIKILQEEDICVLKLSKYAPDDHAALGEKPAFFIVSPNNVLVLTYPITVASDDLFHDIKHLITEPS